MPPVPERTNSRRPELNDPATFYETPEAVADAPTAAPADARMDVTDGDWVMRIAELEDKLAQDRARKPKFQKPALQQAWAAELDALYARLDDATRRDP